MPATIKDVARAAGVSVATVSRALNGFSNVLPATRQHVEEVARQLGFAPSAAARSLITRRTDTIGALLPDLHGEYFSELIRGMDQAARSHGLHLLVSSAHGHARQAAAAFGAMRGRVDGVLVMSPQIGEGESLVDALGDLARGLPTVLVNTPDASRQLPSFLVDNLGGARAMVEHLLATGRRHLVFVGGPRHNHEAAERRRGCLDALAAAGAPAPWELEGDFTEIAGQAAGQRIAERLRAASPELPRPQAVFAANDMTAIGVLAALTAAGVRVPEDIALGGFDDVPIARYVSPSLTTIRVPIVELGIAATHALVQRIENGPQQEAASPPGAFMPSVLPVELLPRRSTAPPAG